MNNPIAMFFSFWFLCEIVRCAPDGSILGRDTNGGDLIGGLVVLVGSSPGALGKFAGS